MQVDQMIFSSGFDKAILNKNLITLKCSLYDETNFSQAYDKDSHCKNGWCNNYDVIDEVANIINR